MKKFFYSVFEKINENFILSEQPDNNQPQTIFVDLTSFLRFDLHCLFKLLRIRYPNISITAYVNFSKPLYNKRKKYVHYMCNTFNVYLFPVVNPVETILRKTVASISKALIVSNSIVLLKKATEAVPSEFVEFIVETRSFQEIRKEIDIRYKIHPLGVLPKKLGLIRSLLKLPYKDARQARGFYLKKHINDAILGQLPLSVEEVKSIIENSKIYPPEQINVALLGFLFHNQVLVDPKNLKVFLQKSEINEKFLNSEDIEDFAYEELIFCDNYQELAKEVNQ